MWCRKEKMKIHPYITTVLVQQCIFIWLL